MKFCFFWKHLQIVDLMLDAMADISDTCQHLQHWCPILTCALWFLFFFISILTQSLMESIFSLPLDFALKWRSWWYCVILAWSSIVRPLTQAHSILFSFFWRELFFWWDLEIGRGGECLGANNTHTHTHRHWIWWW